MTGVEVIRAFLGSPGDLAEERVAAREVVDQINAHVGSSLGLRMELYGWEHQPPGYGRPQGQINPNVDAADLFIGVVWRRWGTPPGGAYTSGFEEEYARAAERRERSGGAPEIWLFFKDVEPAQRDDPGPQLRQALQFRRVVEESREVLYDTFSDLPEWRVLLTRLLAGYLAKRAAESRATARLSASAAPTPSIVLAEPADDLTASPARQKPRYGRPLRGSGDVLVMQKRSSRGARKADTATLAALGLKRIGQFRVIWSSSATSAALRRVGDLVEITPLTGDAVARAGANTSTSRSALDVQLHDGGRVTVRVARGQLVDFHHGAGRAEISWPTLLPLSTVLERLDGTLGTPVGTARTLRTGDSSEHVESTSELVRALRQNERAVVFAQLDFDGVSLEWETPLVAPHMARPLQPGRITLRCGTTTEPNLEPLLVATGTPDVAAAATVVVREVAYPSAGA